MATTTASFRNDQRDLLSDSGATPLFTSTVLDRMRDAELRNFHRYSLDKEVTNFAGAKTDMPLATTTATDWAFPSGWLQVTGVEYWSNETTPLFIMESTSWDDRARTGYVTIFDAPDHFDERIKLLGRKNWTGIDDADMPQEYVDVALYGSCLRALESLSNKRAASRRSAGTRSDTTLGSLTYWIRLWSDKHRALIADARRIRRPIA